jgi:hypothetical protein
MEYKVISLQYRKRWGQGTAYNVGYSWSGRNKFGLLLEIKE